MSEKPKWKTCTEGVYHRRAVASVIAGVLLIAITIIGGSLFYGYSAGLMGSILPATGEQGFDYPVFENIAFATNGSALVTIRNLGTGNARVTGIYVDGVLMYSNLQGLLITPGQGATVIVPGVSATQHAFKLATLDGSGNSVYGPVVVFAVGLATITSASGTGTITYTTYTTTSMYTSAYTTSTWSSTTTYTTYTTRQTTSTTTGTTTLTTIATTTVTNTTACRVCV